MEKIATDIYTFQELRKNSFTYVDKTDRILPLVDLSHGSQFFIARPRRFGKSLLVSTLKCLFQGNRELFKGLALETQWDWSKTYPVVHIDMGSSHSDTVDAFWAKVNDMVDAQAKANGVSVDMEMPADIRFAKLCRACAEKSPTGQFVLLVDEYDKPLLGHLRRPEVDEFRAALKSFYSIVKSNEHLQRFAFITGVSKFSKVSIFSDLNNLIDLTLSAETATLLGYTHNEVKRYFPDRLSKLADANSLPDTDAAFAETVKWYDGYRFHHKAEPVFNPVSLGRCLAEGEFKSYWYETGTPTFLVDILRERPFDISRVDVEEAALGAYEPRNPEIVPLLFQTGYLTIESMHQTGPVREYTLRFPNMEVAYAFSASLAKAYTRLDDISVGSAQRRCLAALASHDIAAFFKSLNVFFAGIPYALTDRQNEQTWQAILVTLLRFLGVWAEAEVMTNDGRIDAVLRAPGEIYVFEFKLDKSAPSALAQIERKRYYERYLHERSRITLIGVNFSSARRTVANWRSKTL